jgi:ribonuclease PH
MEFRHKESTCDSVRLRFSVELCVLLMPKVIIFKECISMYIIDHNYNCDVNSDKAHYAEAHINIITTLRVRISEIVINSIRDFTHFRRFTN